MTLVSINLFLPIIKISALMN